MDKKPFFSLLLPTRDRPHLVKMVLESLEKQHNADFEVIVSDNFINASCFDECEFYKEKLNLNYIRPGKPLSMAENYEYALSHARGDYLIALEDKIMLLPSALKELNRVIQKTNVEIISFYKDLYYGSTESLLEGQWKPLYFYYPECFYSPLKLLKDRINFPIKYLFQQPYLKVRSKVLIGCWSMKLVKRIQQNHKVFQPVSPDYTSMVLGSIYAQTQGYDMGRALGLALVDHRYSNGATTTKQAKKATSFIQESDLNGENEKLSPFKDCYFIQCVSLATDFIKIIL
jgi:glycosyltransferase involved in cell wall biosynthesis